MKPIWYFVGFILLVIGVILTFTGIYLVIVPPEHQTSLSHLHPNIWWGGLMIIVGLIYIFKNRKVTVR
jgi:uncharacterized membrane protein